MGLVWDIKKLQYSKQCGLSFKEPQGKKCNKILEFRIGPNICEDLACDKVAKKITCL